MDRNTPIRKPHTSTADLLTWSEVPPSSAAADSASVPRRSNKPASGISPVMFGGQMSEEEAENVLKSAAKPCSGYKLREITGSGIFALDGENGASESNDAANSSSKTGMRYYQQAVNGMSQISFGSDESVSPKKPITLPEVAKQRELSGNLKTEGDAKLNKQLSEAKCKELSGHDIFGPPPEVPPRPLAARNLELKGHLDFGEPSPRSVHTSVKVSNPSGGHSNLTLSNDVETTAAAKKIANQKFQELSGNDIFKGEQKQGGSAEKPLSAAKLREMSGSNIFADGKSNSRNYYGGDRKPPGGESSIALV